MPSPPPKASTVSSSGATPIDIKSLLRFLSQDARLPLSTALSKIPDLRKADFTNAEAISKSNSTALTPIFGGDAKIARQIFAAAKRIVNPKSKKRPFSSSTDNDTVGGNAKRARRGKDMHSSPDGAELESSLALPSSALSISELEPVTIVTNRAPLLLAFAVTVLAYTMPEQPLSGRLSLAQAVVSANSRSKAKSLGLVDGKSADEERFGEGQPRIRILGREIAVMRRSGYETRTSGGEDGSPGQNEGDTKGKGGGEEGPEQGRSQDTMQEECSLYWGLDLEALRKMNTNHNQNSNRPSSGHHLPIHTPQSAHSYLLKSFTILQEPTKNKISNPYPTEKALALSHLLTSLHHLISSWSDTLSASELDNKAWIWYVRVRPDVESGERGWGQKGKVSLGDVLDLRKKGREW